MLENTEIRMGTINIENNDNYSKDAHAGIARRMNLLMTN